MENNVKERAMEILKPLMYTQPVRVEGHFAVNDTHTYNVLKGLSFDEAIYMIKSMSQEIRNEIGSNLELADAIAEIVEKETKPAECDYVLTERFPKIKNR